MKDDVRGIVSLAGNWKNRTKANLRRQHSCGQTRDSCSCFVLIRGFKPFRGSVFDSWLSSCVSECATGLLARPRECATGLLAFASVLYRAAPSVAILAQAFRCQGATVLQSGLFVVVFLG